MSFLQIGEMIFSESCVSNPKIVLTIDALFRHDGNGTVVAELRPESPLEGMLDPGDKLIAVSVCVYI